MKLTKRSDKVSKDENQLGISRRSFIRNSSLAAAGGVAGASMFAPGMMKKKQKRKRLIRKRLLKLNVPFVLTVLWVVVFTPKYKKVSGLAKSPLLTILLTLVDTVLKVLRYANTVMVSVALNIQ